MRQQHYRFAHQVLPDAMLRNPDAWWAAPEAHAAAMMQQVWAAAGQGLEPQDLVDASSLQVGRLFPNQGPPGVEAVVIALPPPEAPAECYFSALLRVPGGPSRYFVAERGFDAEGGAPRAFWAEWRYGPGGAIMRIRGQDLPQISREALITAAAEECRGAPGAAFGAQPAFTPAPKKKSRTGLIVGCGCLSLFGIVLLIGGWLLYQEEGRGLHIPTSEVASVAVEPGKPFVIKFTWDGTGYAFNNIWLVVDDGAKSGGDFKVSGTVGCGRSASSSPKKIATGLSGYNVHDNVSKGGDAFSAWIYLDDEYAHSSSATIECAGTIEPVSGRWTKARVVVTQRQRPSDFFAR